MAIAGSGAISLSDFRTEFIGGSAAVSLGDLYRGGSNIRALAANNNATNLAADVPTSGVIAFDDFYGTAKGFRKTYASGATNQDASNIFGDDYGVDYPKEIVINSGVELGATSTSQEALQIDSGLSGSMTITNNGTLTGAGGAANGGAGGDAFEADVACTLINNGTIRAGGGGGGQGGAGGAGGTGGQGSYSSTSTGSWNPAPPYYLHSISAPQYVVSHNYALNRYWWSWNGNNFIVGTYSTATTQISGGYQYERSSAIYSYTPQYNSNNYGIRRRTYSTSTTITSGGAGGSGGSAGAGGVGQGYNQSAGSGSSGGSGSGGSGGGTNAGSGGSGGAGGAGAAGGSFGQAGGTGSNGSSGNSGSNGNYSNGSGGSGGSSGSAGGASGKSIRGTSNLIGGVQGSGTLQGLSLIHI